jgi:hypothetical protein
MTIRRIPVVLVALCMFAGVSVGGVASMPTAAPSTHTATAGDVAAVNSTEQVSDCDLIDIDGHNNSVSANITDNATASDSGVSVQYRCGTNASALDHDLIDIDGNDNTVTVFVRTEDASIDFGGSGSAADSSGFHVGLNCGVGTPDDCDGVDIDGHNNSVTLIVTNDTARTVHEFGANSSNVSWTGGEGTAEAGANNSTDTTDEQHETNGGNDSTSKANRSGDEQNRSNDVLDMVVDGIPLVGAATLLVLGSALLVKRNTD